MAPYFLVPWWRNKIQGYGILRWGGAAPVALRWVSKFIDERTQRGLPRKGKWHRPYPQSSAEQRNAINTKLTNLFSLHTCKNDVYKQKYILKKVWELISKFGQVAAVLLKHSMWLHNLQGDDMNLSIPKSSVERMGLLRCDEVS